MSTSNEARGFVMSARKDRLTDSLTYYKSLAGRVILPEDPK